MSLHRLLVKSEDLLQEKPLLSRDAQNHLKVLRPKNGECFELFDGLGKMRIYAYDAALKTLVSSGGVTIVKKPRNVFITLFACVTKGSRWDWTIEKATELGVDRIVPVISERTIVRIPANERSSKRERWLRIAEEAVRQCDAAFLPEICEPLDFTKSLELVRQTKCFFGALLEPMPRSLLCEALEAKEKGCQSCAVFIGPEGDFSASEFDCLLKDATPVSLGPTILRAETASINALSVIAAVMQKT